MTLNFNWNTVVSALLFTISLFFFFIFLPVFELLDLSLSPSIGVFLRDACRKFVYLHDFWLHQCSKLFLLPLPKKNDFTRYGMILSQSFFQALSLLFPFLSHQCYEQSGGVNLFFDGNLIFPLCFRADVLPLTPTQDLHSFAFFPSIRSFIPILMVF